METVQAMMTISSEAEALRLAELTVREKLAACAQVVAPIRSFYRWEGELRRDDEWLVLFKTSTAAQEALIARVVEEHPYDVPEVIVTPVSAGNPAYLEWVAAATEPH